MVSRTRRPLARGLRRERLDLLLGQILGRRLTIVIAPAGSGKTTTLAQFADATTEPVAWYCTDQLDGAEPVFLSYLRAAVAEVVDLGDPAPWESADDVVNALERVDRLVVVIDDLHTIAGQPAEYLLGRIVAQLPRHVSLAIGSRTAPTFDITRWQLDGDVGEISADDLRFRTWEAEHLLDDAYGLLLRPEDVARLTRRVEGWAAGFQLFHLAVRDKPPHEQRRLIESASSRSVLARQYLTQNVLAGLPTNLREFLVDSSVLGVVTGELADELLDRCDSDDDLRRLEELELFVMRLDDTTYRYHEVLRSHLEARLVSQLSAESLSDRFVRAAELLDRAGYTGEAVRCFARAGRWAEVTRLVGRACSEPIGRSYAWLDVLGDPQLGLDPWISLARARADLGSGRFQRASEHYHRAEQLFGDAEPSVACRRERIELESFLDPLASPPAGWLGDLHAGLRGDPIGAAHRLGRSGTPGAGVAGGVLSLAVGDLAAAARSFDDALLHEELPDWALHAGRLGRQIVRLLDGPTEPTTTLAAIDRLIGGLESAWLARFARAVVAVGSGELGIVDAERVARRCQEDGDPWGAAFGHLCAGVAALGDRDVAARHFTAALGIAGRSHTTILEAAAHGGLARALTGADSVEHAREEDRLLRRMGCTTDPIEPLLRFGALHGSIGAPPRPATPVEPDGGDLVIAVRCLGDFAIGVPAVELRALRPRARSVLQRLAIDIGRGVHRDRLIADLWGDADESSAIRSLQVSISTIRRLLDDAGAPVFVERSDGGYVLTEPTEGVCDLAEFQRLQRLVDERGEPASAIIAAAQRALACYGGELLPGAGTAEWAIGRRDQVRIAAARLASTAAAAALAEGDADVAMALAERGLDIDRFDDALWRLAIEAHIRRGDDGAAERLRRGYDDMLGELGIEADRPTRAHSPANA